MMDLITPPSQPLPYEPVTASQWRQAVRAKKPSSAPGPDGVSRADLLLMPDDLLDHLLAVCAHAEHSGEWPVAAMTAVVTALEKIPGAGRVSQFRPIAVLSLTYRVWATVRAKQALHHLSQFSPPTMFGMTPGRSAQSVWYGLQHAVETAHLSKEALCGVVSDLEKAFNFLPRLPVLAYAVHMGLPFPVVRGWTAAVSTLQRRFKVRNCVGPPIASLTGFPEGDPMSCVAMSLVCLGYHSFLASVAPGSTAISYVDNWEAMGSSPAQALAAYQGMQDFCVAWDIRLDESKTVFWATTAADRRHLRQLGHEVLHCARDLGGHLQFSRQATNSTVTSRVLAMEELWPKLQSSHAGYDAKLRAIVTAAWPRAFYGISICSIGSKYVLALRTAALRGLGLSRPGANPAIHLAMVEHPKADPGFVPFRASVLDLRIQLAPEVACAVLDHLSTAPAVNCPGPAGLFLQRLHAVGWVWDPSRHLICDAVSSFDLWQCSPQELQFRLCDAWRTAVARQCCRRPGFQGLDTADVDLTRRSLDKLAASDKASLRIALNGTFFTQDALKHFDMHLTGRCRFCGEQDSLPHRVYDCGFFREGREATGFADLVSARDLLPAQGLHAWGQQAPSLSLLRGQLAALRDEPHSALDLGGMDLFTDGACLQPQQPCLRLASWAIVSDTPAGTPSVVASGPLPGMFQSTFRAELFAVRTLLRIARACTSPFRIWTDCLGVVRKVRTLRSAVRPPAAMAPNADLWLDVWEAMYDLTVSFDINHLPSHEDLAAHSDAVDKWLLRGNHYADIVASAANQERPTAFWDLYDRACREVCFQEETQKVVVSYHQWMARLSTRSAQPAITGDPAGFRILGTRPFQWDQELARLGRSLAHFGRWFTDLVNPWLHKVTSGSDEDLHWISWTHLVVDFIMTTGVRPPIWWRKTWINPGVGPAAGLYPWCITIASRSLAKQVRYLAREAGRDMQTTETRPHGAAFNLQTSCIWMRYPRVRHEVVDAWLVSQLGHITQGRLIHRHTRVWKALPMPSCCPFLSSL